MSRCAPRAPAFEKLYGMVMRDCEHVVLRGARLSELCGSRRSRGADCKGMIAREKTRVGETPPCRRGGWPGFDWTGAEVPGGVFHVHVENAVVEFAKERDVIDALMTQM